MMYEIYYAGIHEGGAQLHQIYNRIHSQVSHVISNWGCKTTQVNNFKQVTNILKSYRIKSFLDVGSGLGSIREYLPKHVAYTGIDVVPGVVAIADDPAITCHDIKSYYPNQKFDAVVALGSFNIGVRFLDVMDALEAMERLANKVVIVSISYVYPYEVDIFRDMGYAIIKNPYEFNETYGDRYILIKQV